MREASTDQLHELTIAQALRQMRDGSLTSVALTRHALERIDRINPAINAFITITAERAIRDAEAADAAFREGRVLGPLQGIPSGLKDIYDTEGIRTTCHSKLRLNHVPRADSYVAQRLREQGAVLLGKLATHEFALGGPSFDLPFPPARNPWNLDRIPGGSCSWPHAHGAWVRHGRLHSRSRRLLWNRRIEADLRPGIPKRCFSALFCARPLRTIGVDGRRCRSRSAGDLRI